MPNIIVRPSWHEVWMTMAHKIAERSHDPSVKVGAIIVTDDNTTVLSVGYNGNYSGGPKCRMSDVPGEGGLIHAEVNCLIKTPFHHQRSKIMYVTLSPCIMCAKLIITAGISCIIYDEEYRDTTGLDLLKSIPDITVKHYSNLMKK